MDLSERTRADPTRHPWETARAAFLLDVLSDADVLGSGGTILDVGAGDAWFASQLLLRSRCEITCWDLHYSDDDCERLRQPRLHPVCAAPRGPFDVALMLDVIEHVDDDDAFVADVVSRTRRGGRVLVSVPAWPLLFSAHDHALQHRRRYTPRSCRALLQHAGLRIDRSGGFFHGLIAARAAAVIVEKIWTPARAGVGGWNHGTFVTNALTTALRAEQGLSKAAADLGVDVPGLSFFALCTLPVPP